jgi:hypothetical protein
MVNDWNEAKINGLHKNMRKYIQYMHTSFTSFFVIKLIRHWYTLKEKLESLVENSDFIVLFFVAGVIILLHIWGFLRYPTILDGLAWLVDNNVIKQHCYARNNKTHVTMVFELIRIEQSGLEIGRVRTCVSGCGLVWGWKAKFVSEIVRGARELIPWTMKTFDHRG